MLACGLGLQESRGECRNACVLPGMTSIIPLSNSMAALCARESSELKQS